MKQQINTPINPIPSFAVGGIVRIDVADLLAWRDSQKTARSAEVTARAERWGLSPTSAAPAVKRGRGRPRKAALLPTEKAATAAADTL